MGVIAMSAGAAAIPRRPDGGDLLPVDELIRRTPGAIRSLRWMNCVVTPSRPTENSTSSSHLSDGPAVLTSTWL